jgi:uncharacterized membrane-anchored protein
MDRPIPQPPLGTDVNMSGTRAPALRGALYVARKVPEVTIFFWIVKLLSTAMGESTSDSLVHAYNPYVVVILGFVAFLAAMVLQLAVRRYVAWVYWLAVVMVAIFGTMAADVLHIEEVDLLHIGLATAYVITSAFFAIALAIIFIVWYAVERTLSIHRINSFRRELFYWATVVTTFALGTATGDMTAYTFHLGYFTSGVLFAVLFVLPGLGYWLVRINPILAFWFAYVMTRPFGASFADWFGRTPSLGGIGVGTVKVSVVLTIVIVAFVAYLTVTRVDVKDAKNSASYAATPRG